MKRIFTTRTFLLLLLLGLVGGYSDSPSATITTTIRNVAVVGDLYTFEVWSRSDADFAIWRSVLAWSANTAALDLSASFQTGPKVVYDPLFATGGYDNSTSVGGTFFYIYISRVGPTATLLANQDTRICTVTLHIKDHSLMSQLAWVPPSTSYPYFYWGAGYAPNGTVNILVGGDDRLLPVQLSSFTIADRDPRRTVLTWTTASEINNYGFEAQRSFDGKTFASIAGSFVSGNGTTNQSHTYSYVDTDPAGTSSYRLKQIDLDGTVTYSEPVQVNTTTGVAEQKPAVFALEQNYPNPFNPSSQIAFVTTKEGPVSLRVYDLLGREVATLVDEYRHAGRYTEQFNGSPLSSGVYVYVLRCSEGRLTGRMILSK